LETKFRPNRRIFVFWRPFLVQNGHHSKPKWSPYGTACLIPCKYPFPLKSVNFWILNDFLIFYIGGHFENFKKQRTQLWVMIYFCVKFQKDPLYCLNLTFFTPWIPWQQPPFWIFFNLQKLPHTMVDILTKFHEVWWKESQKKFNHPFFVSMATAAKFVQAITIFFTCLVPLDVDVVPNKFHQFLFGE
jgi:hypothetical protein